VNFVSTSSEALKANVVVALGGASRAILIGTDPQSDASSRGRAESFANRVIVTTWALSDAIRDTQMGKEFLVDMLRARVYGYGLGNRTAGYVSLVNMQGELTTSFSVDGFEEFVSAYEKALGTNQ